MCDLSTTLLKKNPRFVASHVSFGIRSRGSDHLPLVANVHLVFHVEDQLRNMFFKSTVFQRHAPKSRTFPLLVRPLQMLSNSRFEQYARGNHIVERQRQVGGERRNFQTNV